ncbi:ABC transporter substrate-binding protein [Desulfosporosinus sp. Sb-LF]|uniref:ABC transporter substrate-binding protein n=1 Tax=Desulfosporosinus sp. Sb-LF TaxID=2560027 RepID=UPI00107FBA7F|nr:ABC transporter substrate-binding protein [Desulfosporosinus sp. Sb-LF]TGE33640.1 ABC transporter substrate-binding protein [Desulfosporosinus sp. Sb-LF]
MKKRLAVIISALMTLTLVFSLTACAPNKVADTSKPSVAKKKIGIVQIVEHPSLNTIRESLIKELQAKGFKDGENITIDYQNAQGDQTNLKTIAQKFASNKYDLIVAIATPSAQAVVNETKDIPILFSACTDPLGSGLVTNMEKPGANVTGTSDAVSAEKIMGLAKRITPDIKRIGAIYNSSETNSVSVINNLKDYAKKNNMSVVEATVTNSSDVQQSVTSLVGKVDAIFSPIDNTVASAMPVVTQVANKAKLPVYVGADSMVKDGGLATYGINYDVLGKETGDMAVEILNGKKAGDIPVKTMKDMDIYLNKSTAKEIGINFSDDVLKSATQVFGN